MELFPVIVEVVGSALTVTDLVTWLPAQPVALVSVTATLPPVLPNVTVIWLLFGPLLPAVIVAPLGTVHA